MVGRKSKSKVKTKAKVAAPKKGNNNSIAKKIAELKAAWKKKLDTQISAFKKKIVVLEKRLAEASKSSGKKTKNKKAESKKTATKKAKTKPVNKARKLSAKKMVKPATKPAVKKATKKVSASQKAKKKAPMAKSMHKITATAVTLPGQQLPSKSSQKEEKHPEVAATNDNHWGFAATQTDEKK